MWGSGSPERGQSQQLPSNTAPTRPPTSSPKPIPAPPPPAADPPSAPSKPTNSLPPNTSASTPVTADEIPNPPTPSPAPGTPSPPPAASATPQKPIQAQPAPTIPNPTTPASPPSADSNTAGVCPQIRVRKEWRNMERDVQKSYMSAVKCLLSKPSKLQPGTARRLYDDFVFVHDRSRNSIHWVASFLPWHRHFIYLQEKALIECGYSGSLPRWDWTLDAKNFTRAPVWSSDPETGFGNNGAANTADPNGLGGGTVIDGAFANLQLRYPDQHLLERGFTSPAQFNEGGKMYGSQYYDDTAIEVVHSSENFLNFRVAIEGTNPSSRGVSLPGPHGTIHMIIGGVSSQLASAWIHEIFFLHHGNVDYHWATWQDASSESRLRDYSGNTVQGRNVNNAKITDMLKFLNLSADLPVLKVMDTRAFPYCYEYE
ncbi:hypothetical protein PSTG_00648 [Puccinia striiformis f. sp. tritici PST-78]|uniref:Tyrosinase copper-binding domain-containing protein n=1 Tax=Puccinia striiformis f. sp. tritici PST-78 TaxID=1165861 RepID=A0A0L0W3R9_9BASI|nr:hypothetical protein PSTG_00648 [Puccinia striiformis f. sp. tritici PST-78]